MTSISTLLEQMPREKISILPTPLHRLDRLSALLQRNIYIKRDDLTGFTFGGNKTRKFDFLIADALIKGCDTIIGIGANQSNFCRIMAGVGTRYNLAVHLVLSGKKPEKPTGNLLVDHMLGATVHHVDTSDSAVRMAAAESVRDELIRQGRKVFFLPPGGSVPIGSLGYAAGWEELMQDLERQQLPADKIFLASSSAGTQAGLVLGQSISSWPGQIIGISVDTPKEQLIEDVYRLARDAGKLIGAPARRELVHVDVSYIGAGYGRKTTGGDEAVKLFSRLEGIFLDYVYTGKAAAGMIDYCRSGKIAPDETVVFLHTGGNIELFE